MVVVVVKAIAIAMLSEGFAQTSQASMAPLLAVHELNMPCAG
jgi:hypothetical protein